MNRTEIEHVLETCEFFEHLEKRHILLIAGLCTVNQFKGGEHVFYQGDFGEHIHIIVEGHIFLERALDLGSRKGNVVIEALGKGKVLGCWSTLLGEPHILMSSAACQKPTTVVTINGSNLRQMMIDNSKIGFNLLERLCFLLRNRIQSAYGAMEKI
ncbi:MAG: Crp/Fnr family transcriptional regulator [Desulfobacterales bacterium]|nr:Crp/Fnr family transcriptional regulator [Deltaproteobacteria bacterium]NNK84890.1 Crp/Fnr family transcriptional regulator [Desulfobacterales bacterium]NNL41426.1 Crp/Fnr family transcriptional regulator [Desulfobacterales bacterium]